MNPIRLGLAALALAALALVRPLVAQAPYELLLDGGRVLGPRTGFLALGQSLANVVKWSTMSPADQIKRPELGRSRQRFGA